MNTAEIVHFNQLPYMVEGVISIPHLLNGYYVGYWSLSLPYGIFEIGNQRIKFKITGNEFMALVINSGGNFSNNGINYTLSTSNQLDSESLEFHTKK